MKLCVLTGQYPNQKSPYRHGFVHTRNLWYRRFGHEVMVLVPAKTAQRYVYEGIEVLEAPVKQLVAQMEKMEADVFCVHLLLHRIDTNIDGGVIYDWLLQKQARLLFFIHGVETQKIWQSRRGDIQWRRPATIARMFYRDAYLIKRMTTTFKQFLRASTCRFVAPSMWMFRESFSTTKVPLAETGDVIPNGINTELFEFTDRWQDRCKVLSIRPLTQQAKYAVDLFIDAAANADPKLEFHLYGDGVDTEVHRIQNLASQQVSKSLTLHRHFLKNKEIPALHQNFGLYGAVTRMDAQGVSMCEAMASGLPVVSFDITAISEFVKHGENGFLAPPFDIRRYCDYLQELSEDRDLFDKIAQAGRASMEAIDIRKTCQMEIDLAASL